MEDRSDKEFVEAVRGGNIKAYEVLVLRYSARVFAVCLGILGNVCDSEDIAQESFMKALDRIQSLRDGHQFAGWVSQIARNLCRDLLKSRTRHRELLTQNRETVHPTKDDYSDLMETLEALPEEHRLPLLLYYFDGQKTESVAKALNLSRAGACTRLCRARRALRIQLEKESR